MSARETWHDSVNTVLFFLFDKWGNVEKGRDKFEKISAVGN